MRFHLETFRGQFLFRTILQALTADRSPHADCCAAIAAVLQVDSSATGPPRSARRAEARSTCRGMEVGWQALLAVASRDLI